MNTYQQQNAAMSLSLQAQGNVVVVKGSQKKGEVMQIVNNNLRWLK